MSLREIYPEIVGLRNKWERCLSTVANEEAKDIAAVLMENQAVFMSDRLDDKRWEVARRYGIPSVAWFLNASVALDLVSCQPVLGLKPSCDAQFYDLNSVEGQNMPTVRLDKGKREAPIISIGQKVSPSSCLDEMSAEPSKDYVDEFYKFSVELMAHELDRKIISALRSSAKSTIEMDELSTEAIVDAVVRGGNKVFMKTQRSSASWLVCNPMLGAYIEQANKFSGIGMNMMVGGVRYIGSLYKGTVSEFKVFVDPMYPMNEGLFGYQGLSPLDTGYVWNPCLIFDPVLDENSLPREFNGRHGFTDVSGGYYCKLITPDPRG